MKKQQIVRREVALSPALAHLPLVLQRVYAARGVVEPAQLEKQLQSLLHFDQLSGIDAACHRLFVALQHHQTIVVVGDYDADGATSTTLAVKALRAFGAQNIHYLVPNRFRQGYGLTPEIVTQAFETFTPQVLITVDNGISSVAGVECANQHEVDVIITDHHLPGAVLPPAHAIVNPNQSGCHFTSKSLAGVGVIFYVMLALRRYLQSKNYFTERGLEAPNMSQFLDLVALGTIADVVPLDHNNRTLVHQGLNRIRQKQCCLGISALIDIAKRPQQALQAVDLGFVVGPRLNAAGRIDDMSVGIQCLLAESEETAKALAKQLDQLNQQRRQIETTVKDEARTALQKISLSQNRLPLGICLYQPDWHQGVIGIVAGRLKEAYQRPTIVFADGDNGLIKGSARSIAALNIRDSLDAVAKQQPDLISSFGGHAMAAGLSIQSTHFEAFTKAWLAVLANMIDEKDCVDTFWSDGPLAGDDLNLSMAQLLEEAGPWGQQFPKPLFDNRFELLDQRLLSGKHLKMCLKLENGTELVDAIAFNVATDQWPNYRTRKVHCAYHLDVNRYQGRSRLQLMVTHLEPVDSNEP